MVAVPVFAHGGELLVPCCFVLYVIPALALLFVPWEVWWARFLAVAVLAVAAVFVWQMVLPRMADAKMSSLAEWSILLSPALLALIFAIVLRGARKAAR